LGEILPNWERYYLIGRDITWDAEQKFTCLEVLVECPLVLPVKLKCRQGRALGSEKSECDEEALCDKLALEGMN
jgi:hypothetical protein